MPEPDPDGADPAEATEPITLTDPDGSVTRVAPWSSWTREQVRAPGGEPSLVTHLDEGQLWFAAGRRRSPWRHEVVAGPATITTPAGRFHVIAEPDGGATIACLSGRARVVAGLRDPVVLGPNQTASVSTDGTTFVVTEAAQGDGIESGEPSADAAVPAASADASTGDPADEPAASPTRPRAAPVAPAVTTPPAQDAGHPAASADAETTGDDRDLSAEVVPAAAVTGMALEGPIPVAPAPTRRGRVPWLPELVAAAAVLAVVVAAFVVIGRSGSDPSDVVASAPSPTVSQTVPITTGTAVTTAPTTEAPTTEAPTTRAPTTAPPTTAPPTTAAPAPTAPPVTTSPPALAAPGTASGVLASCRRADGGVQATVAVTHRSGGPGRFAVEVALVDPAGRTFAQATAQSEVIERGANLPVEVMVPVEGAPRGVCELVGVRPA